MSKIGIFLSTAETQEGKNPQIVTPAHRLPVEQQGHSVARGEVPNAYPFASFGIRTASSGETNQVIWPGPAGAFSIPPAAGVQMTIQSTSANDTLTGTNVQKVEIHYLDSNLDPQFEQISMNGLTPVNTTATDIRFINCMHVYQVGTTHYADGDITAEYSGTVYSIVSAMSLRCESSARMVPTGKVCYVEGAMGGSSSGTAAASVILTIAASELDADQFIDPLLLFPYGGIGVQDSSATYNFPTPLKFSAGTVIAMLGSTDKNAVITASWFGWLEDAA